jgi:hypothetical protein
MKTYTKINGELAMWDADTADSLEAINMVKGALPYDHRTAVLAIAYEKPPLVLSINNEA